MFNGKKSIQDAYAAYKGKKMQDTRSYIKHTYAVSPRQIMALVKERYILLYTRAINNYDSSSMFS